MTMGRGAGGRTGRMGSWSMTESSSAVRPSRPLRVSVGAEVDRLLTAPTSGARRRISKEAPELLERFLCFWLSSVHVSAQADRAL